MVIGGNQGNLASDPGAIHEIYDIRTAAGLHSAQGTILAVLEDYAIPATDWCEQILAAHQLGYPVVGGAVEHSGTGAVNWAIYFLDFGRYQLPLKEGPVNFLTDVNITYTRAALEAVRSDWAEAYNEVTVNWALQKQGAVLWLKPQIVVRRDRGRSTWQATLLERFYSGRIFGRKRASEISSPALVGYAVLCPIIPLLVIGRLARKIFTGKRNRLELVKAFPWVILFAWAWSFGELAAYWRHLLVNLSGTQKEIED